MSKDCEEKERLLVDSLGERRARGKHMTEMSQVNDNKAQVKRGRRENV